MHSTMDALNTVCGIAVAEMSKTLKTRKLCALITLDAIEIKKYFFCVFATVKIYKIIFVYRQAKFLQPHVGCQYKM